MNVLACVQSKSPSSSAHPFFLLAAAGRSKEGASLMLSYPVHTDQKAQVRWKGNFLLPQPLVPCVLCCGCTADTIVPLFLPLHPLPPKKTPTQTTTTPPQQTKNTTTQKLPQGDHEANRHPCYPLEPGLGWS